MEFLLKSLRCYPLKGTAMQGAGVQPTIFFLGKNRRGTVPVIQSLKLGADKPYRILLRYCNFHVHRERQLLKFSLESAML